MRVMFLDLETSGLDPAKHVILEGAYLVYDTETKEVLCRNCSLIKQTEFLCQSGALAVNKIDFQDLIDNGIEEHEFLAGMVQDYKKYVCVCFGGYNTQFDLSFIKDKVRLPYKNLDLYSLVLFFEGRSYKLSEITEKYDIKHDAHNAKSDVEVLVDLFEVYKERLK
jgi:DNA polymerase III alpha subunit (gram-positive type)